MQILNIEQLAKLLHKSPTSIRSDRSRKPEALPPSFKLPNSRRVLYKESDVLTFISESVSVSNVKRGRPKKTIK